MELSATEANASLISNRSMSSSVRPAFSSGLLRGVGGRARQVGEVVRHRPPGRRSWPAPAAVGLGPLVAREHERAGAVVHARRVAGGVGAVLTGQPGQLGQALERGVGARRLVDLDHGVALLRADRDRHDLLGQPALVGGLDRELVASAGRTCPCRRGVISSSSPTSVASCAICLPVKGLRQAVVDHRVEHLGVAHAVAEAGLASAGRAPSTSTPCRRPPPTSRSPARTSESIDPGGADARGADLVDGLRGDLLGDAALDLGLARRDLALAGLEDLAERRRA